MSFSAFRAKCTHKGGPIKYDEKTKQLFCPWHGSQFDAATGKVLKDPAKEPLTAYMTNTAVVVSVTPKAS
jgi:Rieske Fe-S protein